MPSTGMEESIKRNLKRALISVKKMKMMMMKLIFQEPYQLLELPMTLSNLILHKLLCHNNQFLKYHNLLFKLKSITLKLKNKNKNTTTVLY
jgi:hypothetical protein